MIIDSEVRTTWYLCCDADGCDSVKKITTTGSGNASQSEMLKKADSAGWAGLDDALGWTGKPERCFCPAHKDGSQ